MKTRRQKILESGYQIQYKVFLLNNPKQPFPGTPQWKNNIPFMEWVQKVQGAFRQEHNLPSDFLVSHTKEWNDILEAEIARYTKPTPIKTRYGSKKKLKPIPKDAKEEYFEQQHQRIFKNITRIKSKIEEFTREDLWASVEWDANNLHDTLDHYKALYWENYHNLQELNLKTYGIAGYY